MKKISIIIPCFNEEKGIGKVIEGIPRKKLEALNYILDIVVVDNNSSDKTAEIAKSKGARVINEKKQGKGHAIIKAFKNLPRDAEIVVMLDGDNTYKSYEMLRLIEPLDTNFCDVVIGTRLSGKMSKDSMSYLNRIGNWALTFLVRIGYHGNVTDVCSGYFAWKKKVIDFIMPYLESEGFAIEMEMITKMARMGFEIYSVPITYECREGHSNLNLFTDGRKILSTWVKNFGWKPKIMYRKKKSWFERQKFFNLK